MLGSGWRGTLRFGWRVRVSGICGLLSLPLCRTVQHDQTRPGGSPGQHVSHPHSVRKSGKAPRSNRPRHIRYAATVMDGQRVSIEALAHDLAIVYLNNRYGPDVSGDLDVSSIGDSSSFEASVSTDRLPDVQAKVTRWVPTGEKSFFGLMDRKKTVETGEFQVDKTFNRMIDDYAEAYGRFLHLLSQRRASAPPPPPPPRR